MDIKSDNLDSNWYNMDMKNATPEVDITLLNTYYLTFKSANNDFNFISSLSNYFEYIESNPKFKKALNEVKNEIKTKDTKNLLPIIKVYDILIKGKKNGDLDRVETAIHTLMTDYPKIEAKLNGEPDYPDFLNFNLPMTHHYFDIFNLKIIKRITESTNKNAIKIKGIRKPLRWEDVTIIYCGEIIKIKQNNTSLGEYDLNDLGIPKIGKTRMDGVRQFFMSLFFIEYYKENTKLDSKNNNQQKLKSNLSKILKEAFETNIDPIGIDKENNRYIPLFKVSISEGLRVNDFASGVKFNDTDKSYIDDYAD